MVVLIILITAKNNKTSTIHMLIGLGEGTSPDVIKFTWSKVKISSITFVINFVNTFY